MLRVDLFKILKCLFSIVFLLAGSMISCASPSDPGTDHPTTTMSGIYTVNPSGGITATNFIRIGQADTAMMTNGISGPVTIQIYNGIYNQSGIALGTVSGSSAINTITFTSFSNDSVQVQITSSLAFNGTSFIIIKKLNIESLVVDGNVTDYTVSNNQIHYFSWLGGDNISFINNFIKPENGFNNLTAVGPAITFGSKSGAFINNVKIENNIFRLVVYKNQAGIGTTGVPNVVNQAQVRKPSIRNNTFRNINMDNTGYGLIGCCTYTSYPFGATFNFDRCTDTAFVEGNHFDSITTNRLVNDINSTNQNDVSPRLSSIVIRNNFFTVTGGLSMTSYGSNPAGIRFYYNNIYGSIAIESSVVALTNNIFHAPYGTIPITYNTMPASSDYNDFYTTGSTLAVSNNVPVTSYSTLAQFQAASGTNAHAKNLNPKYIDTINLHVRHPYLVAAGTPYPVPNNVLFDIDNDPRNQLNPCIGADEFSVPSPDVIAVQYTSVKKDFTANIPLPLKIKIRNNGGAQLNQVNIRWMINGVEQTPYAWSGALNYDSTTEVNFGSYNFDMLKYTALKIWTDLPNGAPDMVPVNDTIRVDSIMPFANGTFTLGGTTPNFISFTKANEVLQYGGVDGGVNVNVRNGFYNEQPVIKFIRGTSLTNTVTFKGENNNANLDTLSFNSTGAGTNKYTTLRLDSAAFVTFRNITIQSVSTYSREVEFINKSRFISFFNCTFTSVSVNPSYAHVDSDVPNSLIPIDSNIVFTNNNFKFGGNGILLPARNSIIKGNRFDNLYGNSGAGYAISLTGNFVGNNSILIDSNFVGNGVSCNFLYGGVCYGYGYNPIGGISIITTATTQDIRVSRNTINAIARTGINITISGSAATPIKVYNNFITQRNGGNALFANGDYTEVTFNSFSDSLNQGADLVQLRGTNNVFRNNLLVKGVPGVTSSSTNSLLNLTSSVIPTLISTNNAYAINDSLKAIFNGNTAVSLYQWKTASGKDAGSVKTFPSFINAGSNLHIDKNKAGAIDIAKKGVQVSYVSLDIDDSTRSLTTPCIGADEFTLNPVDAGALAITAPGFPLALGTSNIVASIRNFGDNNITTASVNWSVNGVLQTPYNYSGNLAPGDSAINLSLGTYNFPTIGKYDIAVWTSNVNGGGDLNALNDSVFRSVFPALCGSYTVAGTTPDFTTLKAAVKYASSAGITCGVTFNIRDGLYNEADTIANIPGSSNLNTLTIQGESLDSTRAVFYQTDYVPSSAGTVFRLDNCKYVTIKNLGIKRTGPGVSHFYFDVLTLVNDITGFNIQNCELATTAGGTIISYNSPGGITPGNIAIKNNNFVSGNYAVTMNGYYNASLRGITISNNNFRKPLAPPYGNTLTQLTLSYANNVTIDNNYFDSAATSTGFVQGLVYQSGSGKISISNNKIMKRKGANGINVSYLSGLNYSDSAFVIANNFVYIDSIGDNYAIYCNAIGRNTKVLFNNVLNAVSTANSASAALYFSNTFGAGTFKDTIANNNIITTGTGYALYEYQATPGDVNSSNNNIWSQTGTKFVNYNYSNYSTISALATASGTHSASVSMNPGYVSNNDLHITEVTLRNLGKPFSYIPNDIDGDIRSATTPTIGADEIVLANYDAGIVGLAAPVKPFAAGNQNISLTIKNFGTVTLTSAVINWSINGTPQPQYNFSGSVPFNTTANVVIGSANFVIDSAFVIKAWTSSPNGNTDPNAANDTVVVNNVYPALNGIYTLGGVTPQFKGFTRSAANLKYGGMLGNTTFNVRDGIYNEYLNVDSIPFQNNFSVTWQGESGDSTKPILKYSPVNGDYVTAVIQLNTTKNITFKNMTVQVKLPAVIPSTYNSMVWLYKKNKNIRFVSNVFIDSSYNVSNNIIGSRFFYDRDPATSSNITNVRAVDSVLVIDKNSFIQVNNSTNSVMEFSGGTTSDYNGNVTVINYLNNLLISNNKFNMQLLSKPGVDVAYADTFRLVTNKLTGNVVAAATNLLLVDKNDVYHEGNGQTVMTINSYTGRPAGKPAVVSNNMIQTKIVGTFNGVPVNNTALYVTGDRVNIIHNTFSSSDTGYITGYNYGVLLNLTNTAYDTVKNNIFYNQSGGYLLNHNTVSNLISNSNDYVYSNHFSNNASTLSAYKTLLGQDAQSVQNIVPYFRGPKDLHASNILLKAAAQASPSYSSYLTDLDGQSRGATTCFGADEFTQPMNDMIVLDASPKKVFSEGVNNFSIHVYNNGSNPITTFNATASITNFPDNTTPSINAGSLNYTFNGNIAPGAEANIPLGQMSVPIYRNILKVNTSNLNNSVDEVNYDDSLQIDNYYAGLNGNYTFKDATNNANPATFKYFNVLSTQLKLGGVYGPTTLSLLPGLYTYNPFYIDSIPNRGALSPLLITSLNGDSSTTGFNTYFTNDLVIYKANNVTISKLYFGVPTNDASYNGLTLGFNSQNMTVQNCRFKRPLYTGNVNTPANFNIFIGGSYSGQYGFTDSNYTIKNNSIEGGYGGIYVLGNPTKPSNNLSITKNTFLNQGTYGITMIAQKNPLIDSNSITTNYTDPTYIAFQSESNNGRMRYMRNRIFIQNDGTGIKAMETYTSPYLLTDTLLIANNFITTGGTAASIGMDIQVKNKKATQIFHNSILGRSTSTSAIGLKTNTLNNNGGRFEVINNIVYNKTAGIAVSVTKDASVTYVQHNDDIYTPGAILGVVNSTNYNTLASLSSSTGIEYNSVSGDPLFVSDNDLHVDGSMVNNTGTYDSYVTVNTDIDNEPRSSTTPDIGADEFKLPNFGVVQLETPLSSCSHTATEPVKAWVKNYGTAPRANIPVAYRINLGTVISDTVRATINPGDSVLFTFLQTANLSSPTNYYFDIWTAYRGDSLPSNDTLKQFLVATTPANNVLPYYTGFESTQAGWYTGGQNSSFKWGVIFSGVIDSAANGLNAWKSNLIGPHNNNELSYLYSPCFDLTSVTTDPTLNFNIAFQLENSVDKVWVEWSGDGGSTWTKLGVQGEGLAWYNSAGDVWSGLNKLWHNAKHILPVSALSDKSRVRVRFVLQTNSSIVQDGIAIDDISIYTSANPPVSGGVYTNRTAVSSGSATFIPVNDPVGNRIVEINDNGQNLGNITVDVNQNNGGVPTQYNGQTYLGRNWVIHVQNQPTTPVRVRLFITQAEVDAWKALDPTISLMRNIGVYKFSGSIEDFDLSNNTSGTSLNVAPAQLVKVPYLDGYFLEFSVSSFSEFWISKAASPVSCLSNNISFSAGSTGSTYQWQLDTGTGFNNISDGGSYTGTTTQTLQLITPPTYTSGYVYRCVVDGVNGPTNILRFILTWTGAINTAWGNTGNWSCATTPDEYTDVVIPTGVTNNPTISVSSSVRKLSIQAGTIITVGTGIELSVKGK